MSALEDAYYARNRRWAAERDARLEQLRRDVRESREQFEASQRTPRLGERSAELLRGRAYVGPVSGWEQAEEQWAAKRLAEPPADPEGRFAPVISPYSSALRRTPSAVGAPTQSALRRALAAEEEAEEAAERERLAREPRVDERAYVGEDLYARGLELRERRRIEVAALADELRAQAEAPPPMAPASRKLAQARRAEAYAAPTTASLLSLIHI